MELPTILVMAAVVLGLAAVNAQPALTTAELTTTTPQTATTTPTTTTPAPGSVLMFTSTPNIVKPSFTRDLTMRCEVSVNQAMAATSDKEVESVSHYWVTYNGEYVASVGTNEVAHGFVDEGNLRVNGSVSGLGFLELRWDNPTVMRMGTYICHVNAKSRGNRFVPLKTKVTITSEAPTMDDLLERINQNEQHSNDEDNRHDEADEQQVSQIQVGRATDDQINTQLRSHQNDINLLQNQATSQTNTITTMQGSLSSLQSRVSSQATSQRNMITTLQRSLSSLQSQVNTMRTQLNSVPYTGSSLQTQVNNIKTRLNLVTNTGLEVRLIGGNGKSYGAVEVTYNGRTGMLCDDHFDTNHNGARVVCRMLGYSSGRYVDGNNYAGYGGSNFVMDDVRCSGRESSLANCRHIGFGNENCSRSELAGVRCS